MIQQTKTGIAIVLAWPQTYCKQPGAWYDKILLAIGINKNHYYRVGHAAIVLFSNKEKECHYFDFGRYHAPFKHGRVRSAETDFDLSLTTIPHIKGNELLNYHEILKELQSHGAFHGDGILEASYTSVNYESALKMAISMQKRKFIPYGPFKRNGSNCSRFVHSVINAGKPGFLNRIKLNWLIPFTPTPMSNVRSFGHRYSQEKLYSETMFTPIKKLVNQQLKNTLLKPEIPENIHPEAKWLSGEGVGSWFVFNYKDNVVQMSRYSADGKHECASRFPNGVHNLNHLNQFELTYPSNCSEITFSYKSETIKLER